MTEGLLTSETENSKFGIFTGINKIITRNTSNLESE